MHGLRVSDEPTANLLLPELLGVGLGLTDVSLVYLRANAF